MIKFQKYGLLPPGLQDMSLDEVERPCEDQAVITNDAQLKTVREQIQRLKSALASLDREVRPKSERQFQVLSEGYVDQIAELGALAVTYLAKGDIQNDVSVKSVALKR